MSKSVIRLTSRLYIDKDCESLLEKNIWHYSYEEFLLKSQVYNSEKKFHLFSEMKKNDGRANSLHYKTGFAASGFIQLLENKMPLITDNLDQPFLFQEYRFELVESDILNKELHCIALYFTSAEWILQEIIGNHLIISEKILPGNEEKNASCRTIALKENLAISHYDTL